MKLIILVALLLLFGCSKATESRIVCTDFITPWAWTARIDDGDAIWKYNGNRNYTHYKIPGGDVCYKESRIKQ